MTSQQAVRTRPAPGPGDVQPVQHETLDRIATGLVTALPVLALAVAVWRLWEGLLKPGDVVVLGVLYVATGLGVTVGFQRLFTLGESWHNNHHAFPTSPAHGLRRWELDPSALVIRALRACGLAWDVVTVEPERWRRRLRDGT